MSDKKFTDNTCKTRNKTGAVLVLTVGGGLYMEVQPGAGSQDGRHWYCAYRVDRPDPATGVMRRVKTREALGAYPTTTLVKALEKRDWIKSILKHGDKDGEHDPREARRKLEAAKLLAAGKNVPFRVVAKQFLDLTYPETDEGRREKKSTLGDAVRFVRYLTDGPIGVPGLGFGDVPITGVTLGDVKKVLNALAKAGKRPTLKRTRMMAIAICRYAVGHCLDHSPLSDVDWKEYTSKDSDGTPRAAQTEEPGFAGVLQKIDTYVATPVAVMNPKTKIGLGVDRRVMGAHLRLLTLTFVRPSELRQAEWREFDLDARMWVVPAERLKMYSSRKRRGKRTDPHDVPLCPQAVATLRELKMVTGDGEYLFPSPQDRCPYFTRGTVLDHMRRAGITEREQCAHGFRASATTILEDARIFRSRAIDLQLNHQDDSYRRGELLDERAEMMDWLGNKVDDLRAGKVVAVDFLLKRKAALAA